MSIEFLVTRAIVACRILFEFLLVFKSIEVCRFLSTWLFFLSLSHQLDSRSCFLNSDGSITFDSSSEVSSSGVFMGRIDIFSSCLEDEECLSKNVISSRPLLSGVCFGIFISVPLIYDAFVL
jgi:hypothetical protein